MVNTRSVIPIEESCEIVRTRNFIDEVRIGKWNGIRGFTKFGYREGLTAAAGEQLVWAATGNSYTPAKLGGAQTFTITYTPASDGVSADGAKILFFDYLDSNGDTATGTHVLGGDGSDVTSFSGYGINRVAVALSGDTETNGAVITVTHTTSGNTMAVIPAGDGVTQQCIYHTPHNADAVAKYLWWNVSKPGGGDAIVRLKAYDHNLTTDTVFEVFRTSIDTTTELTGSIAEPIGFNLSPTDVLYFVADTDTNAANVQVRFSLVEYSRKG